MKHLFLGKGQNTENSSKFSNLGRKVRIVKGVGNRVLRTKTQSKITNVQQTAKKHTCRTCGKTNKRSQREV